MEILMLIGILSIQKSVVSVALNCSDPKSALQYEARVFGQHSIESNLFHNAYASGNVYQCKKICKDKNCVGLTFRQNNSDPLQCKLFNSTRIQDFIRHDVGNMVMLFLPFRCTQKSAIDGGWTDWYNITSCVDIEDGSYYETYTQERNCTNPEPDCNGHHCQGKSRRVIDCKPVFWTTNEVLVEKLGQPFTMHSCEVPWKAMGKMGGTAVGLVDSAPTIFQLRSPGVNGVESTVSICSVDANACLRHSGFKIYLHRVSVDNIYKADSTFWPHFGTLSSHAIWFQSVNYPDYQLFYRTGLTAEMMRSSSYANFNSFCFSPV